VLGDGQTLILKRLPHEGDWLTRSTGGNGRQRVLWETGLLGRVGLELEIAIALRRKTKAVLLVARDLTGDPSRAAKAPSSGRSTHEN